jgi:hypothetical protein
VNRYRYPVVEVTPTGAVVVAEHLTLAEAMDDAAMRDVEAEPGVWYLADEPGTACKHARAN